MLKYNLHQNTSSQCWDESINLNEKLFKNNSEQKKSEEKLRVHVNAKFMRNSPVQRLKKL